MTIRRRLGRLILIAIVIYLIALFLFGQFQNQSPFLPHSHQQPSDQQPGAAAPAAVSTNKNNNNNNNNDNDGADIKTNPSSSTNAKIQYKPSGFDWTTVKPHHPIPPPSSSSSSSSQQRLFKGRPLSLKIQHPSFKNYDHSSKTQQRQEAVRNAFVKSWSSYAKFAFLADELAPVSATPKTTFGGWAATLIDSLDTLHIMNLTDQFNRAASAAVQLDWTKTKDSSVNLFETTIRHLGGLVSAYDLSLEPALLQKARELGDMLLLAFDTPNGIPPFWFDFRKAKTGHLVAGNHEPSAAMGSLSLEFTRLAQLTGDGKYYDAVERVTRFFEDTQEKGRLKGIWPKMMDFRGAVGSEEAVGDGTGFTLGALADSLYEYLIKMVGLLGSDEGGEGKRYEKMYKRAMDVVRKEMLFRPMVPAESKKGAGKGGILFLGDAHVQKSDKETMKVTMVPGGQHLTCFAGGMFALGGKMLDMPSHVLIGEQLARGCAWAYEQFPTGIMPELFRLVPCEGEVDDEGCEWDEEKWKEESKGGNNKKLPKGFTGTSDTRYILRPEAIESIFLLYRITGKEELRDIAWKMFEGVVKATETEYAYSAISDVTVEGETTKLDSMESFWLAETLKYFYLIFSPPDIISLDDYVFNTEAHPFRKPK